MWKRKNTIFVLNNSNHKWKKEKERNIVCNKSIKINEIVKNKKKKFIRQKIVKNLKTQNKFKDWAVRSKNKNKQTKS